MAQQGRQRRVKLIAAIVGVASAIAATIAVVLVNHHPGGSPVASATRPAPTSPPAATPTPAYTFAQVPGGPVPPAAAAVARQLITGTPAQQRAALSAAARAALPAGSGPLYPPGESLTLDADSWRSDDGFANATGVLVGPAGTSQHVEIGFIAAPDQAGAWLVVFEEPTL